MARVTRTYGPIHFEDLDPHRFEDLIRELIYDYKDWQSIEATGRGGNDAGFDIRAYERRPGESVRDEEDAEEVEVGLPMEGNVWMIQGKREQAIGPTRVREIVSEIDAVNPPYGYILAAPANFSRKAYDAFRDELRKKGVMEFYLWGKAELEDMLHLPKNDRILFTFFGVSLTSRRRSRTTEVKSLIATKNKLYRVVGEGRELYKKVLLRDLADSHYPYKDEYPDFTERPRWKERMVSRHHPKGILIHVNRYYAYVDLTRKEWDFTPAVDLCDEEHRSDEESAALQKKQRLVLDAWEFLPKARQAFFKVDGLLHYGNIAAIDEKGDTLYDCPHIFVDFNGDRGPYSGYWETLEVGTETVTTTDEFKRVNRFPKTFIPVTGKSVKKQVSLDAQMLKDFEAYKEVGVLYDVDGRYKRLKARDVVVLEGAATKFGLEQLVQITYVGKATVGDYLKESREPLKHRHAIQLQIGKELADTEVINYREYKRYYKARVNGE